MQYDNTSLRLNGIVETVSLVLVNKDTYIECLIGGFLQYDNVFD